jgi:hypothetical protein
MTIVVQDRYRVVIQPGVEGMIAEMTGSEVGTRICETAGGIGFGKAVGFGTGPKGCVLGGATNFGLSVRDITLVSQGLDPYSNNTNPLDTYGYRTNVAVMSRGHMWVKPQGIVTPGASVYYDQTTGLLGTGAAGMSASGWVRFSQQPSDGQTLVINGATLTFKASGATGDQANIGNTLGDTILNAVTALNASATAGFSAITYAVDPPSPGPPNAGDTILMTVDAAGTAGNALAITSGPPGMTKSGATFAGGAAAGTQIASAYWVLPAMAGQLAIVSLGIQR